MRKGILTLGTLSLALAGCFGPGDPVDLPADAIAAARTCFAAQGLVVRAGKSEDDPVTYSDFLATIKYPMMAAAEVDPFTAEQIGKALDGADKVAEEIRGKDYAGAVATCDARFKVGGADGAVNLPEGDQDALFACMAMGGFMTGTVEQQGVDLADKGKAYTALIERLEETMKNDPKLLAAMLKGDAETLLFAGMKHGFSEGDPEGYMAKCEERFPAS